MADPRIAVCSRPRAASCSPVTTPHADGREGRHRSGVVGHRLPGTIWGAPSTVMVDRQQLLLMPAGQTLTAFALAPSTTPGTR